jgi:hypothetical protein
MIKESLGVGEAVLKFEIMNYYGFLMLPNPARD